MKKTFTIVFATVIILFSAMVSCEKSKTDNQNISKGAEKFLDLKTRINAINAGSGQMSDFLSVIGRSQLKQGDLAISGTDVDSSYIDSISVDPGGYWGSFTCATVTESDNADGTHTTVYDYGTGCDEYGEKYKGKVTYIWSNNGSNYYSKVIYEDYYCYGVTMNGLSEYSFTSDGNSYYSTGTLNSEGDSTVTSSPVVFNWSGSSTAIEDITMVINDTTTYSYKSSYSNKWDSASYTVLQGSYHCKNVSAGYRSEYNYDVTAQLVTNYNCTDAWVPVSGVESITDTENDITNTYSVDYGKGECDNLALFTENGISSIIDFSKIYYQYSDSTGTVSPGEPVRQKKK